MKKILLINLFFLMALSLSSQCNQPYKAFDTFANDTTAFLRYNFKTRADCYKGKTVAYVLKDLQLNPQSVTGLFTSYSGKYEGVQVFIDNHQWNEIPIEKKQYIYIYWDKLLDVKGLEELMWEYDDDLWHQKHYDLFKNNIVGEVHTR